MLAGPATYGWPERSRRPASCRPASAKCRLERMPAGLQRSACSLRSRVVSVCLSVCLRVPSAGEGCALASAPRCGLRAGPRASGAAAAAQTTPPPQRTTRRLRQGVWGSSMGILLASPLAGLPQLFPHRRCEHAGSPYPPARATPLAKKMPSASTSVVWVCGSWTSRRPVGAPCAAGSGTRQVGWAARGGAAGLAQALVQAGWLPPPTPRQPPACREERMEDARGSYCPLLLRAGARRVASARPSGSRGIA